MITKEEVFSLPRKYMSPHYLNREREIAQYIDGKYVTRGRVSEALYPARFGVSGWNEHIMPSRITWEIDIQPGWEGGDFDSPRLCWDSGIILTSEELIEWINTRK